MENHCLIIAFITTIAIITIIAIRVPDNFFINFLGAMIHLFFIDDELC